MQQYRHGTRMTRIGLIFTDISYPRASAQSVFYRTNAIFDDDNKPQMNADERRYFLASEFSKIFHRKELKAHRMISSGIRKTTEGTEDTEKRNKPLCSLCSPWLIIAAGIKYGGFNDREYSIFTQAKLLKEAILHEQ